VGGEVPQLGGNVRIGGEHGPFIAEACEAYDSFLSLYPDIAVLTNIEADHLDHYGSYDAVLDSFRRFALNVKRDDNGIVLCGDDAGIKQIAADIAERGPYMAYGISSPGLRSVAKNITLSPYPAFDWVYRGERVRMELSVPGRHNLLNALAAASLSVVIDCGRPLPRQEVAAALGTFRGATRRQEVLGEIGAGVESVLVMDDYAHHPTEIVATVTALRDAHPHRRLLVVFQPHLYSRTRDFLPQFADALALADVAIVTDIYAAREEPIAGVDAEQIVERLRNRSAAQAIYVPDKRTLPMALAGLVRPSDLVVFMGAGDIRAQGERLAQTLKEHGNR